MNAKLRRAFRMPAIRGRASCPNATPTPDFPALTGRSLARYRNFQNAHTDLIEAAVLDELSRRFGNQDGLAPPTSGTNDRQTDPHRTELDGTGQSMVSAEQIPREDCLETEKKTGWALCIHTGGGGFFLLGPFSVGRLPEIGKVTEEKLKH